MNSLFVNFDWSWEFYAFYDFVFVPFYIIDVLCFFFRSPASCSAMASPAANINFNKPKYSFCVLNFKKNESRRWELLVKKYLIEASEMNVRRIKENNWSKLFETQSAFPAGRVAQWRWQRFLEIIIRRRRSRILLLKIIFLQICEI